MDITASSIISNVTGSVALVSGLLVAGLGSLMMLADMSGALLIVVSGILLLATGIMGISKLRRFFSTKTGISFSTSAVVLILVTGLIVSSGLFVSGFLIYGITDTDANSGEDAANDSDTRSPGAAVDDAPQMEIGFENTSTAENDLHVEYNARAQYSIDPDPDTSTHFDSDSGEKYVVVRMDLTNNGDTDLDLRRSVFRLDVDGAVQDPTTLLGSDGGLSGTTLRPDASTRGWIVFTVSEDVDNAVLIAEPSVYDGYGVSFSQNDEMRINMSA